jgi:pyridoxal phosphate enzyme (YggS family)
VIQITDHLGQIRARVTQALRDADRSDDDITIVAVSKGHSIDSIRTLFANGVTHFGESYVDEALPKIAALTDLEIVWHFIGRIQGNKTRHIAEKFAWVHSLDRERIARRLDAQRPYHAPPLNVLIQVNLAGEPQKGGIEPAGAAELAECLGELKRLRYRGLMGIPPIDASAAALHEYYAAIRTLHDQINRTGADGDTLSMGMSRDFELAIAEGSNCVRIGTALFGPREA